MLLRAFVYRCNPKYGSRRSPRAGIAWRRLPFGTDYSLTAGLERINQLAGPVPVRVIREVDRFLFPYRLQDVTQGVNGERLSHTDQRALHLVNGVRETGERLGRRLLVALGGTFEVRRCFNDAKRFFNAGVSVASA